MKRNIKVCRHCPNYRKKKTYIAVGGPMHKVRKMMGHKCGGRYTLNSYMNQVTFNTWEIPPSCNLKMEYLVLGLKTYAKHKTQH